MKINAEQQKEFLNEYIQKENTQDKCIGFIDGMNKALEFLAEREFDLLLTFLSAIRKELPNESDKLGVLAFKIIEENR